MQAIFCPHCGTKQQYNLAKPKFCSSCGEGMSSFSPREKTRASEPDLDEDEDDDDGVFSNSQSVPKLKGGIQVDIESSASYNALDLGSVIAGKGEKHMEPTRKEPQSISEFVDV